MQAGERDRNRIVSRWLAKRIRYEPSERVVPVSVCIGRKERNLTGAAPYSLRKHRSRQNQIASVHQSNRRQRVVEPPFLLRSLQPEAGFVTRASPRWLAATILGRLIAVALYNAQIGRANRKNP